LELRQAARGRPEVDRAPPDQIALQPAPGEQQPRDADRRAEHPERR